MKRFVQRTHFHKKHAQRFILAGACSFVLLGQAHTQTSTGGEINPGIVNASLPEYSWAEVQKHDSLQNGVWVTYKDGVYDVTKFVPAHPGQEKILMAAGNMIDGFWKFYGMHHTQDVYALLENYRIGNLVESDRGKWKDVSGPYTEDPNDRDSRLIVHSKTPFIAECPNEYLTKSYYTPNELFYVRNHSPVPKVDPEIYELQIGGLGFDSDSDDDEEEGDDFSLSLGKLKEFPKAELDSVIQCGGNRRAELAVQKAIRGSKWKIGALCNAKWGGARLVDVLEAAGITEEKARELGAKHVHFEAMDWGADEPYGASIPIERAFDPRKDVLLAYEMNGVDLPRDHGYPVRVVAPGVVGARNVKWVCRIELSSEEYHGHYQRKAYKTFSPSQGWDDLDWGKFEAIQEMPVQSGISNPAPNSTITKGKKSLTIEGVAWSGNGNGIIRVDVSVDGGKTWKHANLKRPDQPRYREYAWTQWNIEYPLNGDEMELDIVCKAVDTSHNVQPESIDGIFNLRGYCGNSWHSVKVKCTDPPKGWFS